VVARLIIKISILLSGLEIPTAPQVLPAVNLHGRIAGQRRFARMGEYQGWLDYAGED
jgi:hypothetical protein